MVVYVDSVFVLNALMDYLIVLAAAHLAGIPLRRRRYLLAALFGGIYAVAVFFPNCGFLGEWPVKMAVGVGLALIAYGGERQLLRLTLLMFAVSCALAGCVFGLGLLAGGGVPMANGVFYTDVNAKVLLIAAGAAYLVLSVVFRASARHRVQGTLVPVTIALGERHVSMMALCDTGNALRDPVSGQSMLVTAAGSMATLWPPEVRELLTERALQTPAEILEALNQSGIRFRLVPYSAVGVSGGLLLAFRCDWAKIGQRRYEKLLVALSSTELGAGFRALWGEAERGEDHVGTQKMAAAAAAKAGTSAAGERPLHRGKRYAATAAPQGSGSDPAGADRR